MFRVAVLASLLWSTIAGFAAPAAAADIVIDGTFDTATEEILIEEAPDMDCVIGLALLRRFVVEFDYVKARLILHDRESYRPPPSSEAVPLLFRANPREWQARCARGD
jgi:hypothetical protein